MGAAQAVDVRDMLCAQALAVVARAMKPLRTGDALEVRYNAQDVKQDLLVWAKGVGHPANESGPTTLRFRKR